ncbi:MAG: purine-binding chemotaxis protein CheW, partial [Candidatus Latescibacteria bacterium]|nr:purine-binding chemotaxis protein CheW [Candidatus Latescibacterota bacterium]
MSSSIAQKTGEENFSDEGEKELQLVSFKLAEEEFGVEILQVKAINRMVEITPLPDAPAFVKGVMNLRDKLIPVVDLRKRIGLPEHAYDKDTRIIIVEL